MPECLQEPKPLSFNCIMQIVGKFRVGDVDATLGRMILQQLDSGLAQFGSLPTEPDVTVQEEETIEQLCEQAEAICEANTSLSWDEVTHNSTVSVLIILLKMWSLYRKFNR